MEIQVVKKGVLNALNGIITDLNVKEVEDLQDYLSIQMHKLTDDGKRIKLNDLKKELKYNSEFVKKINTRMSNVKKGDYILLTDGYKKELFNL